MGHRSAVPLRAVDAGSPPAPRRRRPAARLRGRAHGGAATRGIEGGRVFRRSVSDARRRVKRLHVGWPLRDDTRWPALYRTASPLPAAFVRAGLRRQRHDARFPRVAPAARGAPRTRRPRSRLVFVYAKVIALDTMYRA